MSHQMLRPFIVKVSVLGYFPLPNKNIPLIEKYIYFIYLCYFTMNIIFNIPIGIHRGVGTIFVMGGGLFISILYYISYYLLLI